MKCPFCCGKLNWDNRWQKYECSNCPYEGGASQTTNLQKYRACEDIDIDEFIRIRLLLYPLIMGVGIVVLIIIIYTLLTSGGG